MTGWRPIGDDAKNGESVLLYSPDAREPQIFLGFWTEWEPIGDGGVGIEPSWTDAWTDREIDTEPTHWMPLPGVPA